MAWCTNTCVGLGLQRDQVLDREDPVRPRRGDAHPLHDGQLVEVVGVADVDLEQEPVPLGLGQRVDALGLDRVLGGQHQERRRAAGGWCRRC